MRWGPAGFVGVLMVVGLLTIPQPAAAFFDLPCWAKPQCLIEEGFELTWDVVKGSLELTWDVISLDPEEFWEDFSDVVGDVVCSDFYPVTTLSQLVNEQLIQRDFDECKKPPHAIAPEVLTKLSLYIKSDLSTVRIHEDCNLDADLIPWWNDASKRDAITFGEHIYFKTDMYHPLKSDGSVDPVGFARLAHELTHVLQYRKKGFGKFSCEYGLHCGFGLYQECAIEQEAYQYEAQVFEDLGKDSDGVFACPLTGDEIDCQTNAKFLACHAPIEQGPKPDYCQHLDNCPYHANSDQKDIDGNGIGEVCDSGTGWTAWTSEEKGGLACGEDMGAVGFSCKGSYCDNVSLACLPVPLGNALDDSKTYWSPPFSEEGASDIELIQCAQGSCESMRMGKNLHYCFGGQGIVTGIRCTGKYCDNIALECTPPQKATLTACAWTKEWLSEEKPGFHYFGKGNVITAVECQGRYCDSKQFRVCSLGIDLVPLLPILFSP